jgi:hypothetical protein
MWAIRLPATTSDTAMNRQFSTNNAIITHSLKVIPLTYKDPITAQQYRIDH